MNFMIDLQQLSLYNNIMLQVCYTIIIKITQSEIRSDKPLPLEKGRHSKHFIFTILFFASSPKLLPLSSPPQLVLCTNNGAVKIQFAVLCNTIFKSCTTLSDNKICSIKFLVKIYIVSPKFTRFTRVSLSHNSHFITLLR